ncbi:MAG: transglycosylase domain-containing protein [Deltaproteobacteria bacterium]|nr:transglycosylase domain-containing protein [Deltaproteobacteria bacterium]
MTKNLPQRRALAGHRFVRGRLIIALAIIAIFLGIVLFTLPYVVRVRVVSTLGSRFGAEVSIGDISLDLLSIGLKDIQIKSSVKKDFAFEIDELVSRANLFVLLLDGINAITSVEARGVSGDLDLQSAFIKSIADRLSTTTRVFGRTHRSGKTADFSIKDVDLAIRDNNRALISLKGQRVRYDAGVLETHLGEIQIGSQADGLLTLSDVYISASRVEHGFVLQRGVIGSARVVLPERSTWLPESSGQAGDIKDGVNVDSKESASLSFSKNKNKKLTGAAIPAGESRSDDQSKETLANNGQFARLFEAIRSLSASESTLNMNKQKANDESAHERRSIYDWLKKDVSFELRNASVSTRSEDGVRLILERLRGRAVGRASGGFDLDGEGSASEGGSVFWDMRVWPDELRADGRLVFASLPLAIIAPLLPEVPWYLPEQSRVDAQLTLKTQSVERLEVSGRAQVANAALFLPRIAPHPISGIDFAIQGQGHFYPLKRRLEIDKAKIELGKAVASLSGAMEWTSDHYIFDIDARLPITECQIAVGAIPRDLLEELVGFEWNGSIGGAFKLQIDSRALDNAVMKIEVKDRCEFTMVPSLADLRRFRMPFLHYVLEPDGSEIEFETGPGTKNWTYLEEISPFFVHAVLSHEDVQFFQHAGFSPAHIRNALVRNLREGRYAVGASTITMQLVKNLFLKREKTLARKVQEVLLTWWVERVMDKRDILELYLNVIEYGPGIYGIRNGARHYFNRLPSELSPAESIYLSMILPNPKLYHGQFERGSVSSSWKDRMVQALRRMGDRGWYSQDAVQYGQQELEKFSFYPEGEAVASRKIPGGTSPLPYMEAFDNAWDWAEKALEQKANHRDLRLESERKKENPTPLNTKE